MRRNKWCIGKQPCMKEEAAHDAHSRNILFENLTSSKSDLLFYGHRKATFKNWCFDKDNYQCSSDALAKAGFYFTGSRYEPAAATCAFCYKEMIFEENDDPWLEHRSHSKTCNFVELNKREEKDWTVNDFMFLLSGRIAAEQRSKMKQFIENYDEASAEIEAMTAKALHSLK
ncbi:unnamed protein product [Cylicocyclus nassatus]|uniref:Uncharacterized protein n=1 Tax=Cylicocyclus nassatus TaxID=53992 RepID=A0AA36DR33_CYLNA|nr:unnamed protein product [Cylicocyclus nassatus]